MRTFFLLLLLVLSGCAPMDYPPENEDCIVLKEFVYEDSDIESCHASTLVQTDEGDLLTAFFGGTHEGHPDCSIWLCRKREGGQWEKPVKLVSGKVDGDDSACWNPVLFQVPGGKLFLFYKVGHSVSEWIGYMMSSEDGGFTWSTPKKLPDGFLGPSKNKPLIVGDKIIYGSSSESGRWLVHFEYSDLNGENWAKSGDINKDIQRVNIIQPTFLMHKNGTIQAICRSKSTYRDLYTTFSEDKGASWSQPSTIHLPSNNSGLDALTLSDGTFLLAFNCTTPGGTDGKAPRTPLNIHYFFDGMEWKPFVLLETGSGEFSYPAIIQTSDGLVHVVYTYKRQKIRHVVIDLSRAVFPNKQK